MATVGSAGYSSQQPALYEPSMLISTAPTRIWGITGNSDVVIDASCHPSSCIVVTPTGATPAGLWKVVVGNGTFTVTSSSSESAGLTYNYTLL